MRAAERDREFSEYFTARAVGFRRLAYGMCGDWHLAEDLTQTTFIRLYRHWHRIDPPTLDAYARRVLVNAFLSHRRDRRRESVVAAVPDLALPDTDPTSLPALAAALSALPPRQRALVVLRHLADVSVAEAAELLGITEGTVKSQTARGLATLRNVLTPITNGE